MPSDRTFDPEQVATLYVEALELGLPIISTIGEVMSVGESTARHMVRVATRDGFLGLAPHAPARATIHRGSKQLRTWLVCEHCLTAWPCADAYPYRTPGKPKKRRRNKEDSA